MEQIPDLFRDGVWQFVGALIAFVALIAFFVQWSRTTERAELKYTILRYSLVNPGAEYIFGPQDTPQVEIEVLANGESLVNPQVVTLLLSNTGNKAIRREDYDLPININLGEGAKIIGPMSVRGNRVGLVDAVADSEDSWMHGNEITIDRVLLNPGDEIELRFLVEDPKNFVVRGRIVGIPELVNLPLTDLLSAQSTPTLALASTVAIMIGVTLMASVMYWYFDRSFPVMSFVLFTLSLMAMPVLVLIAFYRQIDSLIVKLVGWYEERKSS